MEEYSSGVHVGTHVDAPCHFSPGSWCVDQIPIERLIAPVAVIDIEEKAEDNRDYEVTIDDLKDWENETGHILEDIIIMIRSGWGKRWGDREQFTGTPGNDSTELHFPGLAPETAQWLVDERNVYGVGTETLSIDNGPSTDLKSHTTLLGANVFFIENVANVDKLPLYGATLHVMPMKIGNGSGAPTRVIATFPDMKYQSKRKDKTLREVIIFG